MNRKNINAVISGTGSYIPTKVIPNKYFLKSEFYDKDGKKFEIPNEDIIKKFESITCIKERRYVTDDLVTSDIAFFAAKDALISANISAEDLDFIIVAHNFGDVKSDNRKTDIVPTLASRVKHKLGIKNPDTTAYDLPFGCPGWLQGFIQASIYIKSGAASKALVIGAETLSRVSDPHDRDSMIYADGAGATVIETFDSKNPAGILSYSVKTDTAEHAYLLRMDKSYKRY